ncbi:MAG: hypothetical protein MZV70_46915 [Desulfobacterales bacterium]|nr:hypothetical protein [Desulfobacterales bacterium]
MPAQPRRDHDDRRGERAAAAGRGPAAPPGADGGGAGQQRKPGVRRGRETWQAVVQGRMKGDHLSGLLIPLDTVISFVKEK